MKKEVIKKKSFLLILLAEISLFPLSAQALDCTATPDCASMGYTKSASDCKNKLTVKCPTDSSKLFCKKGIDVECTIGSVLGNDQLCYDVDAIPSNVIPIGVMYTGKDKYGVAFKIAVALKNSPSMQVPWSLAPACDVTELANKVAESGNGTIATFGKTATALIVNSSSCNGSNSAAAYARQYQPSFCSLSFCKAGEWFLGGNIMNSIIVSKDSSLNKTLEALQNKGVNVELLDNVAYWTSIEYSATQAYVVQASPGGAVTAYVDKNSLRFVRPILLLE